MNNTTAISMYFALSMFVIIGCSQEKRDDAVDRLAKAGKALNGEVRPNDIEHDTPNIVAEQQRRERIRQNTLWTAENQALHPVEYCQAQLEEAKKMADRLDVQQHTLLVTKSSLTRKIEDYEIVEKQMSQFLANAKKAYRDAEKANQELVEINGYAVTKDKAQVAIVDANKKMVSARSQIGPCKNSLAKVSSRLSQLGKEQHRVAELRERLQMTVNDLKTKKVIEGEKGISDAIRSIESSMDALQSTLNDPDVADIMVPDEAKQHKAEFEAIMAE